MYKLLFIHLSSPEIESGSVVDVRNLIREFVQHCSNVFEVILFTNDYKLLIDLKDKRSKYITILFLPLYENPLYSLKFSVRILMTVISYLKHINKGLVFIGEEYPTVVLPLLYLLRFFSTSIIVYKHHSYNYIKFKEEIKFSSRIFVKLYQYIFYIVLSTIFSFSIKMLKPYILVPNQQLADYFKTTYGIPAVYIPPGNYPPYIPTDIDNTDYKTEICFVSSKISLDFIPILRLFYNKFFKKINIYGKPYGPQYAYVYSKLQTENYLKYYGTLKRDLLIKNLLRHCKIGIYISYYDTWSYTLYELLLTTRFVYLVVPIKEVLDTLIDIYKYMFGNSIKIYSKSLVALFSLVNFDDSQLTILQKKYVNGYCYLLKILYDSHYSRKF
jgi:hypothetical protein